MFSAVREGEFLLYYQPIVDARTRLIEGFETLMRWKHPTLGMVPPVRFIPIAETNGLINLLGAWALKAACAQLLQFEEAAKRELYISVNISPRQFRSDKFLDVLDDALALSGMPGKKLVLEITEGTLMVDPQHAETILHQDGRAPGAHRDRRLRHRLFLAGLPEALPDLGAEDRPRLREGPAGRAQGSGDLQRRARHGAPPRPVGRGRRRRDRGAAGLAPAARLPLHPGLPDGQADAGPRRPGRPARQPLHGIAAARAARQAHHDPSRYFQPRQRPTPPSPCCGNASGARATCPASRAPSTPSWPRCAARTSANSR